MRATTIPCNDSRFQTEGQEPKSKINNQSLISKKETLFIKGHPTLSRRPNGTTSSIRIKIQSLREAEPVHPTF